MPSSKVRVIDVRYKHGKRHTRLYGIWLQMKTRCYNANCDRFDDYGGRGITVCDEWKNDFQSFYDWSMSHGYDDSLSIDRINNDGNYAPGNCRWATRIIQSRNTRRSHLITFNGETHTLVEWCEIKGLSRSCLDNRIRYGWDVERALNTPMRKNKNTKRKDLKCVI